MSVDHWHLQTPKEWAIPDPQRFEIDDHYTATVDTAELAAQYLVTATREIVDQYHLGNDALERRLLRLPVWETLLGHNMDVLTMLSVGRNRIVHYGVLYVAGCDTRCSPARGG